MALNLDREVQLPTTKVLNDRFDHLSTLYGLIISLDFLERAYIRDSITQDQYEPACKRLLGQYKTITKLIGDGMTTLSQFMTEYKMDCTAAAHRLDIGLTATEEHKSFDGAEATQWVAETTQTFITIMDALKLKQRAKDQLHPLLSELMSSYTRFKDSSEWQGRPKLLQWLIALNKMRASEEITEDQSREMFFDIEHAYSEFFRSLSAK